MSGNQNPAPDRPRLRLAAHWRTVSWALCDKGLQVLALVFVLWVARALPPSEFALYVLTTTVVLTVSQVLRSIWLVPLTRCVAEDARMGRVASTGLSLYAGTSVLCALLLWLGRDAGAAVFDKPGLGAVLVPGAATLALGSPRDASIAALEG